MGRGSAGAYVGPAPFILPRKPSKGASATRRGTGTGYPGAPYFHVSAFILPTKPAKGTSATRRGVSSAGPGAKWAAVTHPSKFYPRGKPAKGTDATRRGTSRSEPGAQWVYVRTSPFYAPHKPAKGTPAITRGRGYAGSATGQGAPQVPRTLIISLASAAGVDDYGNTFPQGIQVGSLAVGPQVQIIPATPGSASQVIFPVPSPDLVNQPNLAAFGGTQSAALEISGPNLATSGAQDWVQIELWSNNGEGVPSSLDINRISTDGDATISAQLVNGSGWTFHDPVTVNDGIAVNDMTSPNGNPVFGWSEDDSYPLSTTGTDTNSGSTFADGERALMNSLWSTPINNLTELVNYIYAVLQDSGIIAGG